MLDEIMQEVISNAEACAGLKAKAVEVITDRNIKDEHFHSEALMLVLREICAAKRNFKVSFKKVPSRTKTGSRSVGNCKLSVLQPCENVQYLATTTTQPSTSRNVFVIDDGAVGKLLFSGGTEVDMKA